MYKSRSFVRVWIALLVLAVTALPVNGAHLHLCFDGSEPAATYHPVADAGVDAHDASDLTIHRDRDVSAQSAVVAKKSDGGYDLPSLISTAVLVTRLSVEPPLPAPVYDVPSPVSLQVAHRLPPLRGPPV